ncbi:MAG: hypothetical protein HC906_02540 [Bacteroidales bacterium]|nr:hypothetical protein [Bacteroidales bacterium]
MERYLNNPRHIEVQILGDQYGNVVHLFERECSLQRRFQKIIEEAPASGLTKKEREKLLESAVLIGKSIGYSNAGTVEFLIDEEKNFYFLEMNTRIQVEHPVTELTTGIDIIKEQIRIASGAKLTFQQHEIKAVGHSIEARIYAEDPASGFLPSPGEIHYSYFPEQKNIRLDSGIQAPCSVQSHYDPMLAKVISFAPDRKQAIEELQKYLSQTVIHGIKNNIGFLKKLLKNNHVLEQKTGVNFIEQNLKDLTLPTSKTKQDLIPVFLACALVILISGNVQISGNDKTNKIWKNIGFWRQIYRIPIEYKEFQSMIHFYGPFGKEMEFYLDEEKYSLQNIDYENNLVHFTFQNKAFSYRCSVNHRKIWLTDKEATYKLIRKDILKKNGVYSDIDDKSNNQKHISSPMYGKF